MGGKWDLMGWVSLGREGMEHDANKIHKNLTLLQMFKQEKKKFQSSFDNSFLKESKSGNQAIDLFLDRANPYNKVFFCFLCC